MRASRQPGWGIFCYRVAGNVTSQLFDVKRSPHCYRNFRTNLTFVIDAYPKWLAFVPISHYSITRNNHLRCLAALTPFAQPVAVRANRRALRLAHIGSDSSASHVPSEVIVGAVEHGRRAIVNTSAISSLERRSTASGKRKSNHARSAGQYFYAARHHNKAKYGFFRARTGFARLPAPCAAARRDERAATPAGPLARCREPTGVA